MATEEQPPAPAPAEGGEPKLSKNALKKKLKAEKAAKAKAEKAAAKVSDGCVFLTFDPVSFVNKNYAYLEFNSFLTSCLFSNFYEI